MPYYFPYVPVTIHVAVPFPVYYFLPYLTLSTPYRNQDLSTHHKRKDDGDRLDLFDHPKSSETEDLDRSEEMDPAQRNVAEEHVVRLVLGWHEHDHDTLDKLQGSHNDGLYMLDKLQRQAYRS